MTATPLVASTSTLVAERWRESIMAMLMEVEKENKDDSDDHNLISHDYYYPAEVGILLLGVILLDSINLSVSAGKVTDRDRNAVADLIAHTDWSTLAPATRQTLHLPVLPSSEDESSAESSADETTTTNTPSWTATAEDNDHDNTEQRNIIINTTLLFDVLQESKFNTTFWASLSIADALRLDYKVRTCTRVYTCWSWNANAFVFIYEKSRPAALFVTLFVFSLSHMAPLSFCFVFFSFSFSHIMCVCCIGYFISDCML